MFKIFSKKKQKKKHNDVETSEVKTIFLCCPD